MTKEYGFFVEYGDGFYSKSFDKLSEARTEAKKYSNKKLRIFHGNLKRINEELIDDSELSLIPRIGGYNT
jgi:hypothetical protein